MDIILDLVETIISPIKRFQINGFVVMNFSVLMDSNSAIKVFLLVEFYWTWQYICGRTTIHGVYENMHI